MPFVFMRRGFRRAMRSMPLQHADVDAVLEAEPDPDEAELVRFEQHCKLLETHRYKGVEWLQVQLWLIFEDASSSLTAKVVQASILVLIIFSTLLILVQSFNECKWIDDAQVDGIPFADLAPCRFESNHSQPGIPSCTRVCEERKEPLDQGGPVHYFVMDAICIGCFTIEFLLRLLSSPATIGLGAFLSSVPNWIDVVAIVPFYIDIIVLLAAPGAAAGGGRVLAVLRIVRLTRVLRVLKFSKSLSGIVVLVRTVAQSGSAMALIATFTILNCVLWASLMMATPEVGKWEQGVNISGGEYLRVDGTNSPFARTMEGWWWCLQTLTSVGYGVPYAPMEELGKITSMITALVGTVVLALPIAVVGLTFDDEWNKQAKVNNFQSLSCIHEYNTATLNGTRRVSAPATGMLDRLAQWWPRVFSNRVAPNNGEEEEDPQEDDEYGVGHVETKREAVSLNGARFAAGSHVENQAYNLQADMSTLLDSHFDTIRRATTQILDEQKEKVCRSLATDLKAALRDHVLTAQGVDAFKHAMQKAMLAKSLSADSAPDPLRVRDGMKRAGFARCVAMAHAQAKSESGTLQVADTVQAAVSVQSLDTAPAAANGESNKEETLVTNM